MTKNMCLDAAIDPGFALAPEQAMPIVSIPKRQKRGIAQRDDNTRLIEMRQRALRARAPLRTGDRYLGGLAQVQRRLQRRIAQPDQRVEQVVPIALARGDFTALGDA